MPKKLTYSLRPLALQDLEGIWLYTNETWSLSQADGYLSSLFVACELLANGTKVGKDASAVRAKYFSYSIASHIIFYKLTATGIDVVRVLHQQMDYERHL